MVPKKKTSKSKTRSRRSHHGLKSLNLVACPKCGASKPPHNACDNCGYVSSKVAIKAKTEG